MHSPHVPSQPLLPHARPAQSATHAGGTVVGGRFFFFFFLRFLAPAFSTPNEASNNVNAPPNTRLNATRRGATVEYERVNISKRFASTPRPPGHKETGCRVWLDVAPLADSLAVNRLGDPITVGHRNVQIKATFCSGRKSATPHQEANYPYFALCGMAVDRAWQRRDRPDRRRIWLQHGKRRGPDQEASLRSCRSSINTHLRRAR